MAKQTQPVEVKLVDQDETHWQLETTQGRLIGRIVKDGKRYLSYFGLETQAGRQHSLEEATQDLLLQYNLHQH
ncbi:DUF2969 family protein [Lapidilactobacillus wuchangensis]|uniref:DUF2969 family protein n=1 Tax=Lapidilactobacillus wuchangensis TaxID=2486001 RepID=UPI000F7B417F|nr:DUF2969 family protein [Lapidilactobacillus wuchangensis]